MAQQTQEVKSNTFDNSPVQIAQAKLAVVQIIFTKGGQLFDKAFLVSLHKRFILALNLSFSALISYFRGYPFPYIKSMEAIFLCLFGSKSKLRSWLKEFILHLDELYSNNAKTEENFDQLASELWLVPVLIEGLLGSKYAKDTALTDWLIDILDEFQKSKHDVYDSLKKYSKELSEKHQRLDKLQAVISRNLNATTKDLKSLGGRVHTWMCLTKADRKLYPLQLVFIIDTYIKSNPDRISVFSLVLVRNFKELILWAIKLTRKNSSDSLENEIRKLLESFPGFNGSYAGSTIERSSGGLGDISFLDHLKILFEGAEEQFQINSHLETENEQCRKKIRDQNSVIQHLEDEQDNLQLALDDSKLEVSKLRETNLKKETVVIGVLSKLKRFEKENPSLDNQIRLEEKLKAAQNEVEKLKSLNKEIKGEIASLTEENEDLKNYKQLLEENTERMQDQHNEDEAEKQEMREQLQEIKTIVKELRNKELRNKELRERHVVLDLSMTGLQEIQTSVIGESGLSEQTPKDICSGEYQSQNTNPSYPIIVDSLQNNA